MKIVGWLVLLSVLAVPILLASAWLSWFNVARQTLSAWRSSLGIIGTAMVLIAWTLFLVGTFKGWIGGFGSHYITQPWIADRCLMTSLVGVLCTSLLRSRSRAYGVLAGILTFLVWGGSELVA
jgi:hypothetical protein